MIIYTGFLVGDLGEVLGGFAGSGIVAYEELALAVGITVSKIPL